MSSKLLHPLDQAIKDQTVAMVDTNEPQAPSELVSVDPKEEAARAAEIMAERVKIQAARSVTAAKLADAQAEVTAANAALAAIEAKSALSEDSEMPDLKVARRRLSTAREAVESFTARQAGLSDMLAANDTRVRQCRESLTEVQGGWAHQKLAEHREQMLESIAVLRRARA